MSNEKLHAALRDEFPNKHKRRRMIKLLKSGKIQQEINNKVSRDIYENERRKYDW
jgi:hypothetical protein